MGTSWARAWGCCRKGDPFQGRRVRSCLTLGNELSEETHVLTKQETLLGRGARAENRRVGNPRELLCLVACSFMMTGLVSGLSLASHPDSGFLLVAHTLLSQDGFQRGGFWEVVGCVVSPFDLSQTLPVGGGLLVPCSLPGPPVLK